MSVPDGEADILAAEQALGLLEGDERDAAEHRAVHESGFADAVARWSHRFALLADMRAVMPPASAWTRIEAALDDGSARAAGVSRWWRPAALGGFGIAAALLLVVSERPAMPPPPIVPNASASPAPALAAVLAGRDGAGTVTMSYEPATRRLVTLPVGLTLPRNRAAELWVIPKGRPPIALWIVDPARPASRIVTGQALIALTRTATFAVSIEPPSGSPTGQPTGPVILSGPASAA